MSNPGVADTQVNKNSMGESSNTNSADLSNAQVDWEKRYKDTQAAYTRSRQELAEAKAKLTVLEPMAKPALSIDEAAKAELDDLKYRDPDTWREKLSILEAESRKSFDSKVADNLRNLSELERRQLVLEDFVARNPGFVINDDVIAYDIPPRITKKLEKGEISFEEFLEETKTYMQAPKVIGSANTALNQPNLTKVGGDSSYTKNAADKDFVSQYKKIIY